MYSQNGCCRILHATSNYSNGGRIYDPEKFKLASLLKKTCKNVIILMLS